MKSGIRSVLSSLLFAATLAVPVVVFLALVPRPGPLSVSPNHPPGCHACSLCPPEHAASLDAFLVRNGFIEELPAFD